MLAPSTMYVPVLLPPDIPDMPQHHFAAIF